MKKKKINLVTLNSKDCIDFNINNLSLDELYFKEKLNKSVEKFEIKYWRKLENRNSDYGYLKNLYERISDVIFKELNTIHKKDYPDRYWGIIFSHSLITLLQIFWYKWQCLKELKNNPYDINFKYLSYEDKDLTPYDTFDIRIKKGPYDCEWHHYVYADIIKFGKEFNFKCHEIYTKKKKNEKIYINNRPTNSSKIFINKLLSIFEKNKNLYLYDTYFSFRDRYILEKKFSQSFSEENFFKKPLQFNKNELLNNKRQKITMNNFKAFNFFEEYLKNRITNFIPYSFVELFDIINQKLKKISHKPKIIFTANAHINNDVFNIWAANKTLNKTKYIIGDHGSYLMDYLNFDLWTKYYDYFATWINWAEKKNKKHVQLPIHILKKIKKRKNKKNILFIYKDIPPFFYKFTNGPLSIQVLEQYEKWKVFFDNLNYSIKKNIIIRNPSEDKWRLNQKFRENYNFKISKSKNIYKDFITSKINILTYPETAWIQSINSDLPTMLIINKEYWKIPKRYSNIFNKLEKLKILFYDFKKASNHLNIINNNPNEWWLSSEIQETLNELKMNFSIKDDNYLKKWEIFFKKKLSE